MIKDFLFPKLFTMFLVEARDSGVIVVTSSFEGIERPLFRIWLDSSKKYLMFSVAEPHDIENIKKDLYNMISYLVIGRFFKRSFLDNFFDKKEIKVLNKENISKGNKELYGFPYSYFRFKFDDGKDINKDEIIEELNKFKEMWNRTQNNLKILNVK